MANYLVGIDGGGSTCRAAIIDSTNNTILGKGLSGPANPVHGQDIAFGSIISAVTEAIKQAGLPASTLAQVKVAAGLAGVNIAKYMHVMQSWQHPFKSFHVVSDLNIACYGAHQAMTGACIISGTGSCGVLLEQDSCLMLGGHGFLLGDKGSGASLGLQALKYSLEAIDGLVPPSSLSTALLQHLNANSADDVVSLMSHAKPNDFAKLAPSVFQHAQQGDEAALNMVSEHGQYLSAMADSLLSKAETRLSLLGGLSTLFTPYLSPEIQKILSPALAEPLDGALFLAKQYYK